MKRSPLPLESANSNSNSNYNEKNKYKNKESLLKLLRWHFGHAQFRGKQLDAILAVLSGRDCFCLMPTGGGKSLCYQIPALARKTGIVLVVCPLIALMENQVMALKEKEIAAEYLSSTQTSQARNKVYEDIESGKPTLRLLYVTPELLDTTGFMSKLKKLHGRGLLNLIAIDEAHCISTWGHDFRPSYRKISSVRNHFFDVPILALTATAVPKVQQDVINSLCLRNPLVLKSSFNRPNIFYEVRYKDLLDDVYADMSNILKSTGDVCAIIYCLERTTCDSLSSHLSRTGISCAAYHAGLNNKLRSSVLDDWVSSKIQVVVATVAFGMGIDRKDVRIVCHFNIPKSMEAFYQESGRAGRDQLPCQSFLYYGLDDRKRMVAIFGEFILSNAKNKKLQSSNSEDGGSKKSLADFSQMVEYCEESGCRRKKILESFGEEVSPLLCGKTCDYCKHPNLVKKKLEEIASVYHNKSSRVFISSSSDLVDRGQFSEFWNRDEGSDSSEDISDSEDESEHVKGLMSSKPSKRLGINQKIEFLERAEENYYQKDIPQKKISRADKNAISEAMREGSKQRLVNALKQAQQRLGNLKVEYETSAALLEDECYQKYGKTGKTFYYSQVASTVRWISTANASELTDRLGSSSSFPLETGMSKKTAVAALPLNDQGTTEVPSQQDNPAIPLPAFEQGQTESLNVEGGNSTIVSSVLLGQPEIKLPSVPSFSEFVNSRKSNDTKLKSVKKSPDRTQNTSDKRIRLQ